MFNGATIYRCSSLTGKIVYPEPRALDEDAAKLEEVKALHAWAEAQPVTRERVYFIGASNGPIKIGYSSNIPGRLRSLRYGSPADLKVLADRVGGRLREAAYHAQFAEFRLRGEWFEPAEPLIAEVRRIRRVERAAARKALTEGSKALWW